MDASPITKEFPNAAGSNMYERGSENRWKINEAEMKPKLLVGAGI
jgi:hypothetical protein